MSESSFGKVADPLADRLMIGTAVVLTWATGRIPLVAALVILARDLALIVGYRTLAPRGYELDVTFLGKLATWVVYASLGFVLVTDEGTRWPLVLLWLGIARHRRRRPVPAPCTELTPRRLMPPLEQGHGLRARTTFELST